jgi:hypothetical protein
MWMSQGAHILYLSLHASLRPVVVDGGFRYVFHGDPLSGDRVGGHWSSVTLESKLGVSKYHILFTLPKVPSAMSLLTLYSPSLEAGKTPGISVMVVEDTKDYMSEVRVITLDVETIFFRSTYTKSYNNM